MAWIFLVLAALFETAWTFCLKFIKLSNLRRLRFKSFYKRDGGLPILVPFVGFVLLGLTITYLLSLAMKQLPPATVMAVWTASTLIFLKITEVLFFRQQISLIEVLFMVLIIIGIVGLRIYAVQAQ